MLFYIVLACTAAVYFFALLNRVLLKWKAPAALRDVFQVVHFALIPFFLFPFVLLFYTGEAYYYKGLYTNFIIFWSFLISGFFLSGFEGRVPPNRVVKLYGSFFLYGWLTAMMLLLIVPFIILLGIYTLLVYATPPEKIVYSDANFRVQEIMIEQMMSPKNQVNFVLYQRENYLDKRKDFHLNTGSDVTPEIKNVSVKYHTLDTALVYLTFDHPVKQGDSLAEKAEIKVKLE